MDQSERIANLEAEVAALHLFVISLTNGIGGGSTQEEFDSEFCVLQFDLLDAHLSASAERLDDAYSAIKYRTTRHLVR
jgi:hypothetical protein